MNRSILLALVAALALAVGTSTATATVAAVGPDAPTAAAKTKKKAGKKKAAKCRTAKKKGKGRARKSVAAESAAKGQAKGKGKKKAKRKCGKAKPKQRVSPRQRPGRYRTPYEERLLERYRERRDSRPTPPPAPTIQDMVPADGTYGSASAPGLSVTISGNGTTARVVYTVPKTAFDSLCQAHTEGVPVDLSGPLSPSQSTMRGHVTFNDTRPMPDSRSWSVNGSIGKDHSFTISVRASFPYPADPNATCSGYANLSGVLVAQ